MSKVKQRHTNPELAVRSLLHRLGYRFRLHRKDLPGSPDIVLPKYKTAIFVHGCFWHQHSGCKKAGRPSSNTDYWNNKLDENIKRDAKKESELKELGWNFFTVWQCEIKNKEILAEKINRLLKNL
jgi:DNA mismatch endonuclease (patch repair protein)